MKNVPQLRRQIVEFGKRLYKRDYVGGAEGNLSVRLDRVKVLITPAGKCLGYLKPSEMVIISSGGKKISGKFSQSSEYRLHLGIYNRRRDINAVCHAHPICSTAFAVAGIALDKMILPEIISALGVIPLVDYGAPGTSELFAKMADIIDCHDAFLLRNHGVVTLGTNLDDAFNKMEMVERYARILITASILGKPSQLPKQLAAKIPGYDKVKLQMANSKTKRKKLI